MANVENIRKAIQVMERVKAHESNCDRKLLDLRYFQSAPDSVKVETENEVLHKCGTTCCFAGWLGVSPEFKEMGLTVSLNMGIPYLKGDVYLNTDEALMELLGLSFSDVHGLIYNEKYGTPYYYGKVMGDVTVDDVIEKLKSFID